MKDVYIVNKVIPYVNDDAAFCVDKGHTCRSQLIRKGF